MIYILIYNEINVIKYAKIDKISLKYCEIILSFHEILFSLRQILSVL